MAFDWLKYYDLALKLKELESEEAIRSGISRTYYAVFGKTKIMCSNFRILNHSELHSSQVHKKIIDVLKLHDDPYLSKIGTYVETLRDRRNKADYDAFDKESESIKTLVDSMDLANTAIELIKDYAN